jgi:hypothetical protein
MEIFTIVLILSVAGLAIVLTVVGVVLWRLRVNAGSLPYPGKSLLYPSVHSDLDLDNVILEKNGTVIVVTDYNESAGFGWLLYNALNTFHLCHNIGKYARPVIFFTKGFYAERRPEFIAKHGAEFAYDKINWFNNYFEPLEPHGWRKYLQRYYSSNVHAPSARINTGVGVAQFDRSSLDLLTGNKRDYTSMWNKYLKPLPHIEKKYAKLRADLLSPTTCKFVYAVHYRGTDKFSHSGVQNPITGMITNVSFEDDPVHVPYNWVFDRVAEEVAIGIKTGRHGRHDYRVLVASDEAPFVEQAFRLLGGERIVVSKPDTIRADVTTSGLEMDTRLCGVGRMSSNPDCHHLQKLVDASVHRGHREKSGYLKGEDVLLETMLLSEGDVFFRSKGNFSNLPTYMRRNPKQRVIDMASLWRSRSKT